MIIVTVTRPDDIAQVELQPAQIEQLEDFAGEMAGLLEDSWCALTLRDAGTVYGVVGIVEPRAGCAHAWALIANDLNNRGHAVTSAVRRVIEFARRERGLRRIDMMVDPAIPKHIVWAKRLRFKKEGTLRGFGRSGEDLDIMSRVWN